MESLLKMSRKLKDWSFYKGSLKDPFLYLGMVALILYGVIVFSLPTSQVKTFIFTEVPQNNKRVFLVPEPKIKESPNLSLIQGNSLKAVSPPMTVTTQVLAALIGAMPLEETRREIIEYTVKEGDSLWSIANKFNISVDTIVWANDITNALIRPGQKLLILPVSGVMHLVEAGDTVNALAEKYNADPEKIIAFNGLLGEGDIFEGEILIIPDGQMPSPAKVQPVALARLSTNNFFGQSHSYPFGQCTWWVAQRRPIPNWGHARDWLDNAEAAGYSVCRGRFCIPRVGAVIALKGHPIYGHVGYVEEVRGNRVTFSEMNNIGWGRVNYRTLKIGDPLILGYIY